MQLHSQSVTAASPSTHKLTSKTSALCADHVSHSPQLPFLNRSNTLIFPSADPSANLVP